MKRFKALVFEITPDQVSNIMLSPTSLDAFDFSKNVTPDNFKLLPSEIKLTNTTPEISEQIQDYLKFLSKNKISQMPIHDT